MPPTDTAAIETAIKALLADRGRVAEVDGPTRRLCRSVLLDAPCLLGRDLPYDGDFVAALARYLARPVHEARHIPAGLRNAIVHVLRAVVAKVAAGTGGCPAVVVHGAALRQAESPVPLARRPFWTTE